MRVFCVFFCFFRAKIWPAAAGTGELARDLRDQTRTRAPSKPGVARGSGLSVASASEGHGASGGSSHAGPGPPTS